MRQASFTHSAVVVSAIAIATSSKLYPSSQSWSVDHLVA
jgi:hypothetical protein